MSIEGGLFQCYIHEYETGSVKAWDKHCFENGHVLQVNQQCKQCKKWNSDMSYPYPERYVERSHSNKPEDKDLIVLKCAHCNK